MWVHLLRHGIAIDPTDPACPTDPERFLTEKGRARTELATAGLRRVVEPPTLVLSSPYVRARQTAEIALAAFGGEIPIETSDALVPMADPSKIVEVLRGRSEASILCVGHAPNLDLVAALLAGADDPVTSLKKAGAASLEIRSGRAAAGNGVLVGVYPASVLRKLGGGADD